MSSLFLSEWLVACTIGGVCALLSLCAVWATLGRQHWALRGAVLIIGLAALFHVTAYEAVVFFSVQFGLMIPVLLVARRKRWFDWMPSNLNTIEANGERLQFFMRDVLLLVTLSACWFAVLSMSVQRHLPINFDVFLTNVVLAGSFSVVAAIGVLARWRLIAGLQWMSLLIMHFAGFCYSSYQHDWLLLKSLVGTRVSQYLAIFAVYVGTVLAALALTRTAMRRIPQIGETDTSRSKRAVGRAGRVAMTLFGGLLLIPLSWLYWKMAFPPSHAQPIPGDESRFSQLISLGPKLPSPLSSKNEGDAENYDLYKQFVLDHKAELAQAHALVDGPLHYKLSYQARRADSIDFTPGISELRDVARAFVSEGVWQDSVENTDRAVNCYLDTIQLGQNYARDKPAIHYLVGTAIEGMGLQPLVEVRHKLDRDQCLKLCRILQQREMSLTTFDESLKREYIWTMYYVGWYGRLSTILAELTGEFDEFAPYMNDLRAERDAIFRMLRLELALRAYRLDHGQLPETLSALSAVYLDAIPVDPFNGKSFVYRKAPPGEFVLYSVGKNRVDDGGVVVDELKGNVYSIPDELESLRADDVGGVESDQGDLFLDRFTWFNPTNRFNKSAED